MNPSAKKKKGLRGLRKGELGAMAKAVGGYGLGAGIGAGTGYLANRYALPKILPHMSQGQREAAAFATGFASAIAVDAAKKRAHQYVSDSADKAERK